MAPAPYVDAIYLLIFLEEEIETMAFSVEYFYRQVQAMTAVRDNPKLKMLEYPQTYTCILSGILQIGITKVVNFISSSVICKSLDFKVNTRLTSSYLDPGAPTRYSFYFNVLQARLQFTESFWSLLLNKLGT